MPRSRFLSGRAVRALLRSLAVLAALACVAAKAAEWSWSAGATAVYQDADRSRGEVNASADFTLGLTHGRGRWFAYLEASTRPGPDGVTSLYPSANADAGSVVDGDGGGAQISELHYRLGLPGEAGLALGLVDVTAWLDATSISNDETAHFVNASLVNNASIAFPDYTLGAVYTRPGLVAVLAGTAGLADFDDRRYERLFDLGESGRGLFAAIEAQWSGAAMTAGLGAWLRSDDHPVGANPMDAESNYGVYTTWQWAGGPHAVDARAGVANGRVSAAGHFAALAYTRRTGLGLIGVGIAHTGLASDFDGPQRDDQWDGELFLKVSLADGALAITPAVQRIGNPGFDASARTVPARATVFGVRFNWAFAAP